MRRSLAAKLTIAMSSVALLALIAWIGLSAVVLRSAADRTTEAGQTIASDAIGAAIRREGEGLSSALAEEARNPVAGYDFERLKDISSNLLDSEDVLTVLVVGPRGYILADGSDAPALRRMRSPERPPEEAYVVREEAGQLRFARRIEAGGRDLGFVVLGLSLAPREEARRQLGDSIQRDRERGTLDLLRAALVAAFVLALLAALGAAVLGRRLARPIVELQAASARVAAGDLSTRVEPRSEDEIGRLTQTFNDMTAQLGAARDAAVEQARMKNELDIAAQLQLALVPKRLVHGELEIVGRLKPADEVGGDFYDVLMNDQGDLWLTMGDVTGHGLPAGFVMLMAQTCFATLFGEDARSPLPDVLRSANRILHAQVAGRLQQDKYATAQLLAYRGGGRFELAGAHEWPFILRAQTGESELIESKGPWLAILPELAKVPVGELTLERGDVLCLYSDGIIETAGPGDELFDVDRLMEAVKASLGRDPSLDVAADAVMAAVEAYGVRQDDDRTLLLIRYTGGAAA